MADNQHYVIDDGQNKIPGYTKTEVDELIESGAKAWSGTQAEYNALKQAGLLQPRSLYIITDAANLNGTAADLSFDGSSTTTKQAIDGKAVRAGGLIADLNNTSRLEGSITAYMYNGGATNSPSGSAGGWLISMLNSGSSSYGSQIAFSNGGMFWRKLVAGNFTSWATVAS